MSCDELCYIYTNLVFRKIKMSYCRKAYTLINLKVKRVSLPRLDELVGIKFRLHFVALSRSDVLTVTGGVNGTISVACSGTCGTTWQEAIDTKRPMRLPADIEGSAHLRLLSSSHHRHGATCDASPAPNKFRNGTRSERETVFDLDLKILVPAYHAPPWWKFEISLSIDRLPPGSTCLSSILSTQFSNW